MKIICLLAGLSLMTGLLIAQPASEIYLFDLSIKKDKVSISNPVNITNHKGYDNQPSFHPDLPVVYYTSASDSSHTDIFSYNYKTKASGPVTQTPEKEYSPTVTPDKQYLSCIIQRENGVQDLGKYPINPKDGVTPSMIIDNLKVGYHVWADNSHLGLFVLGNPNTLHYLRLPTKKDTIIAEKIGRSLNKIPGESSISFVHKLSDTEWLIKKFDTGTRKISTVATTVSGHEDLTWLSDGKILMSDGPKLFYTQPANGPGWNQVLVVSGAEVLKGVTRLAVSPDGKKLAVVVAE
jgi:Tol biopolymer transport system component